MINEDSTKQRILMAAGPIFAANGFRGATVRDISVAADVNLASINYYFGDKQKLYVETVKIARAMRMAEFPSPKPNPTADPEQSLEDYIRLLLNRLVPVKDAPWQVVLLMREFMNPTDACGELIEEFMRPVFQILLRIVDRIVDGSLEQHQLHKVGFSIIGQCLHYRCAAETISMVVEPEEFEQFFDIEQLTQHITLFSLGAIQRLSQSTKPTTRSSN